MQIVPVESETLYARMGRIPSNQGRDWPTRNTLQAMTTLSNLITALIAVESSGNDQAIGDNGRALGPLQIHRGVVQDVNRITGSHYKHSEMTNRVAARAVCEAYLKAYGKGATTEQLARRWNGGPTGDRKSATEAYWAKVKKHLK
ncbi:MAG: transglycosylase SLT domain-containing protein [Candidatus Pacebacteria bacterium]|nr:transglycosylase SLT domain-containing protein [Candidatus Paceibacterota bacterium]